MLSHPPVQISDFAAHVARLKANDAALFAAEYESIDPGGQFTWEASNLDVNKPKNRYANVIAYDHSRVRLQQLDGLAPGSDYINANYLDGYCRPSAYIATQVRAVSRQAAARKSQKIVWEDVSPIHYVLFRFFLFPILPFPLPSLFPAAKWPHRFS